MENVPKYDCRFPGSSDEISGNGLPKESTRELTKYHRPPVYNMLDDLLGNKPPYNQTGTY